MIVYISKTNKDKYFNVDADFKRFLKKEARASFDNDAFISIVALGIDRKIRGGAILSKVDSGAASLMNITIASSLCEAEKAKASYEVCAAIQEYCIANQIRSLSASISPKLEKWLQAYKWEFVTLLNRNSPEENSIVSLKADYEQLIEFIFNGDMTPMFSCNSPTLLGSCYNS